MDLIPSFQINHEKLVPGIYVSRIDKMDENYITTFDIRMKLPNREPMMQGNAMHTIEHLAATYLRANEEWKDQIIYWGPMGCLTGCYFIMKGLREPKDILQLMIDTFEFCANFEGEIPGAQPKECGTYIYHDLAMAKYEAKKYLEILKNDPCMVYPEY